MFPFYQLSTEKGLSLRIVASFCNDGFFSFRLVRQEGNRYTENTKNAYQL